MGFCPLDLVHGRRILPASLHLLGSCSLGFLWDSVPSILFCWDSVPSILFCWDSVPSILFCWDSVPSILFCWDSVHSIFLLRFCLFDILLGFCLLDLFGGNLSNNVSPWWNSFYSISSGGTRSIRFFAVIFLPIRFSRRSSIKQIVRWDSVH